MKYLHSGQAKGSPRRKRQKSIISSRQNKKEGYAEVSLNTQLKESNPRDTSNQKVLPNTIQKL